MEVSELIEKLKSCRQDTRVVAPGYEDGFNDILDVEDIFIKPDADAGRWFYGHHEHLLKKEPGAEKAVRPKASRRYGDGN